MSERGVFAVDRGIWDHPVFADEPFTEREAWTWLISEAAFRSRQKRIGGIVFDLEPGQLVVSLRFMAERWGWTKGKVERFLERLRTGTTGRGGRPKKNLEKPLSQTETMIETRTETGVTIITICNYRKYQRVSLPTGTPNETENGTATRHQRDKLEDTKNIELDDGGGSARAKLVSDEAQDTADAMAAACGFPDPKACPLGWYGAAIWVQKCLNEGWAPDLMVEGSRATAARKRDGPIENYRYLEKPLARFIAEHSRPLPQVEFRESEKITVTHGRNEKAQSLSDVARRHAEAGIGFGERPTIPSLRLLEGGSDVRLLSQGGSERPGNIRGGDRGGS